MAICSLGANSTTYPVAPSNCKYDAFKVQETNVPVPPAADLFVTKDAAGTDVNPFKWGIKKGVDQTTINSSSGSATFNYTVTVTHDTGTVSDVEVTGTIQVFNPNTNGTGGTLAVSISGVTDQLSDGTSCSVSGVPESLTAFETDLAYTCDLSGLPQALNNTATVSWSDQALSDGGTLTGGSADFTFSNISFTESAIDDCVTVSDTFGGSLGTICSKASSPQNLTYSHEFTGNTAGTCPSHTNTATFTTNTTSTTGSDSKIVNVCVGADLTVAKTATPSFTRTYGWSILKGVDPARQNIASGGSATFNYTVNAGETGFTDSGWQVNGTITATNPNDWEAITANVTDAIDNGGICTVTGGTSVVVPKSDHVTLNYTCTYSSAPSSASGTNTPPATWDSGAASTPSGSDDGTKIFAFNDGSAGNPSRVHQTVTITDAFNGGAPGTLGTLTATDAAPFASSTYNESRNLSGAPGTCTDYPNVAAIVETNQNSNATVKVFVGVDLTVSKTANPSFTRTYNWTISKNVDKTLLDAGGTATYTVAATETGFTDSAWKVSGTITVVNPNDWEAITINVTDTIDHSGTCVVTGGVGVTIPKSGSVPLAYICSFSANPVSGTNTGTASWDSGAFLTPHGSASGGASYLFGDLTNRVNQTITIPDTIQGVTTTLGTLTASDASPFTTHAYVYTRHFNPPSSGCVTITNTAKIVETNATAKIGRAH